MGEIIRVACSECDYGQQYRTGSGLMSTRPQVVEKELKGNDLEAWKTLWEREEIEFFSWKYEMAYCQTCRKLRSVFKVDIRKKSGTRLFLGCRCPECEEELAGYEKNEMMQCPFCGKMSVNRYITGRWD